MNISLIKYLLLILTATNVSFGDELSDVAGSSGTSFKPVIVTVSKVESNCKCVPSRLCLNYGEDFGKGLLDIRANIIGGCSPSEVCCESTIFDNPFASPPLTQSLKSECGIRNVKEIVPSGERGNPDTKYGEYPWMVAIFNLVQEGSTFVNRFECSGILIHESVVLTAAHCAIKLDLISSKVRAGVWDLDSYDEPQVYQERDVNQIIIHERFNDSTLFNDVALIVTMEPFKKDSAVDIMCLPRTEDISFLNSSCLAVGWGKNVLERPSLVVTEELLQSRMLGPEANIPDLTAGINKALNDIKESHKKVVNFFEDARKRWKNDVERIRAHFQRKADAARKLHQNILATLFPKFPPVPQWSLNGKVIAAQSEREILKASRVGLVPRLDCQTKWRSEANLGGKFVLRDSFICARSIDEGNNCKGDTSLICPVKGERDKYQIVGIASWGSDCNNASPSVFANVGKFKSWIDDQLTFLELQPNNAQN